MKRALLFALIALVGPFSFVDAAIVAQQTSQNGFQLVSGGTSVGECISTDLGVVNLSQYSMQMDFAVDGVQMIGYVYQFDDANCSTGIVQVASQNRTFNIVDSGIVTFDFGDFQTIPGKYYLLAPIKTSGGADHKIYGTTYDSLSGAFWWGGTTSIQDAYFTLEGYFATSTESATTSSRIISQIAPGNGATTPTTAVQFEYSWFNNPVDGAFNFVQTEISDVTQGFQYTPIQFPIVSSAYATTTHGKNLTQGHYHLWRACLLNSTTNEKRCSGYHSFNVVTASASSSYPVLPDINGDNATSTAEGSIWAFLNAYQLLQTRVPFAYFFAVAGLITELQATSTETIQPVVFDFADLDVSTTTKNSLPATWAAFSTTTITQWIPDPVLDAWRLLMQAVLWFSFAAYMYHAISKLFTGNTNTV